MTKRSSIQGLIKTASSARQLPPQVLTNTLQLPKVACTPGRGSEEARLPVVISDDEREQRTCSSYPQSQAGSDHQQRATSSCSPSPAPPAWSQRSCRFGLRA